MKQDDPEGKNGMITIHSDPQDISSYIGGEKKSFVLFEMTSCPFCQVFEGRFIDLASSRGRDFNFMRVTINDPGNPLWSKYDIQAVPTVIAFAGGQAVSRVDSILFVGITKKNWTEFCAGL
jgi:thioredoxin 1